MQQMRQPVLRQLYREEIYKHYSTLDDGKTSVKNDEEFNKKKEDFNSKTQEQKEECERQAVKDQWKRVTRSILQVYRHNEKSKSQKEFLIKRINTSYYKEMKKQFGRVIRSVNEYNLRAKKIQREMLVFWRKKDREVEEIQKRVEKIKKDIRKKEEEEKEKQRQKKRLEFLMAQSDIYAHFMAEKLGLSVSTKQNQSYNNQM